MTPTPIPEEFIKEMYDAAGKYDFASGRYLTSKGMDFVSGAEWAYRLLSSQGLRWVELKDGNALGKYASLSWNLSPRNKNKMKNDVKHFNRTTGEPIKPIRPSWLIRAICYLKNLIK